MSQIHTFPLRACLVVLGMVLGLAHATAGQMFERPVPEGGGPTVIRCALAVLDVDEISDASQNFTVNLFARFEWEDPREAHGRDGKIAKGLDEVWHPKLFFANMQRTWSTVGGSVEISPDGEVVLRQQFWGSFSQPMGLHDFPFDEQVFTIQVVPVGPEEFGDLMLIPDPEFKSFLTENYSVANWEMVGMELSTDPATMPTGALLESFAFTFTAERLSQHYLVKVIAPLLMIVALSWVVFWLDPSEGGTQLGVAVTAFLTVIAYHVALSSKLPEIPYLTRLDVFVFGTTFLVFLAMIEVVITTGLARTERVKMARWMDRVCRFLFPGALALVTIYAFAWH